MRVLFSLCFSIGLLSGFAQNEAFDNYLEAYAQRGDFRGCVSIQEKDDIVYQRCIGRADEIGNTPNQPRTAFMIGSISKQFTAAAVLRLQEEGMLTLSDSLEQFFTDTPVPKGITIQHLLTHRSGIQDLFNLPELDSLSDAGASIEKVARKLLSLDLGFPPGTQYQYSNGGYAVLASIIEQVSGMDYGAYLFRSVIKPLGMKRTGHPLDPVLVPNLAVGYDPAGANSVKKAPLLSTEVLKGSGSLYSTVEDMWIWIQSLRDRSFLAKASYEQMFSDYGNGYGLGISVYNSFENDVFGHDGRISGFIADYLHYENADRTVIVLGNIQTGVADFFRRDLAAILFQADWTLPDQRGKPIALGLDELQRYTGTYAFGPQFNVYVELREGTLQARANQGGYAELIPLEDGRFFTRTLYAYMRFTEDEQGRIIRLEWMNNDGHSFAGQRKE